MKIESLEQLLSKPVIAVHDGPFHADDVLCIALLKMFGFQWDIIRTRDPEKLRNVVGIDVAGSATGGQFDHHGADAKAGICSLLKLWDFILFHGGLLNKTAADRFDHLLHKEFEAVADIDSGAVKNPGERPNMFSWIALMNDGTDAAFFAAVGMAKEILKAAWRKAYEWEDTCRVVAESIHPCYTGGYDSHWNPKVPPILNEEKAGAKEALWDYGCQSPFFVSPHGNEWTVIQAAPIGQPFNPFGGTRVLPKEWGGLRGEELQKVSGYESAIFAFAPGGGDTVMAFFGRKEDAVAAAIAVCA